MGKTELSYTYTQTARNDRPYNLYHGTLEARPVTATTSKLVYTIFFDNSILADDAAREADKARRVTTFTRALQNMKTLAEGGTLPPAPPRALVQALGVGLGLVLVAGSIQAGSANARLASSAVARAGRPDRRFARVAHDHEG